VLESKEALDRLDSLRIDVRDIDEFDRCPVGEPSRGGGRRGGKLLMIQANQTRMRTQYWWFYSATSYARKF
jgi:hypothetical protein